MTSAMARVLGPNSLPSTMPPRLTKKITTRQTLECARQATGASRAAHACAVRTGYR
jgi:hypothetical protein